MEGTDFTCFTQKRVTQRKDGQEGSALEMEHHITLAMAKELAMVENNTRGLIEANRVLATLKFIDNE